MKPKWRLAQFEKSFLTQAARRLPARRVVFPESPDHLLLAHNHMCRWKVPRQQGKFQQGVVASRLDKHRVADQTNAFQYPRFIATAVKAAAIEFALQPIVTNETAHDRSVERTFTEEPQDFRLAFLGEPLCH